jgi:translocator protein
MLRSLPAKIILCIVIMEVLGGLGAFLTSGSISSWYSTLVRPPGTPPNWVFGPVWSTLYAMIGISFALIWQQGGLGKNRLTFFFFAQLFLNLIWTPVFFGAHLIVPALIVIILMWLFIALTIRAFAKVSKPAAYLLIPYLLWVSYATYLNVGYAVLNQTPPQGARGASRP